MANLAMPASSLICFFFFKQKTAYELRISDWSSDVCSSDLAQHRGGQGAQGFGRDPRSPQHCDQRAARRAQRRQGGGRGSLDRKSVVKGKSVSVRVALGGRRSMKKKTQKPRHIYSN